MEKLIKMESKIFQDYIQSEIDEYKKNRELYLGKIIAVIGDPKTAKVAGKKFNTDNDLLTNERKFLEELYNCEILSVEPELNWFNDDMTLYSIKFKPSDEDMIEDLEHKLMLLKSKARLNK